MEDALLGWPVPKHLGKLFSLRKHQKALGNSAVVLSQCLNLGGLFGLILCLDKASIWVHAQAA